MLKVVYELEKIIKHQETLLKGFQDYLAEKDNTWSVLLKNNKTMFQIEHRNWYLEWLSRYLKNEIKKLNPDFNLDFDLDSEKVKVPSDE